jgi:hypothetical protein
VRRTLRADRVWSGSSRRWYADEHSCRDRYRQLEHLQGAASAVRRLTLAYVLFGGTLGTAWDDAMVARWSANPLGTRS